jgi:O-antigen ligase
MIKGTHHIKLHNPWVHHGAALVSGIILGNDLLPDTGILLLVCLVAFLVLLNGFIGKLENALSILPFLCYTEIYWRDRTEEVPYLFMPYFFILFFGLMIFKQWPLIRVHTRTILFLFFFIVVELLNATRSEDPVYARFLLTNSVALFFVALWASCNVLTDSQINRLLYNLKLAGIFICGVIMVSQITHDVSYGKFSMSEALNGLAPVQISGYLGLTAILFFLSIMYKDGKQVLLLNILCFGLSTTYMALSFSRGGLYFLAAIMALFFAFNFKKLSSIYLLFLLVPVLYLVYTYTVSNTEGLILERYGDTNTSGRNLLVESGIKLFIMRPFNGFGTANFSSALLDNKLYFTESGAHNEFVRTLAEHGLLGAVPYFGFYISLIFEVWQRQEERRQMGIFILVLFFLILVHNALKISIQPLLLLFVIATPYQVRTGAGSSIAETQLATKTQ